MALQSEVSPPIVGDTNKDTKIDGDTKSIDNDTSQSTEDEEVDLEEGEILDSGGEEEDSKENTQSQLKEALDIKLFKTIEKLAASPAKASPEKKVVRPNVNSQRPVKKIYLDHDRIDDNEDDKAWSPHSLRPKAAQKFNEGPIDYRKELDAYRGSPSSSPDRKRGRSDKARKKKSKSGKSNRKRKEKKGLRDPKTRRKGLCRYYKEGKCSKGSDCQFAHIGPTKKKELCKFYISNTCFKGKSCIYMHDDFPCKFYHTNTRCYADEKCRYSHKPLTEETEALLAEYLSGQHHGNNDDYDNRDSNRKRHHSPTPEPTPPVIPAKRPCLLGSPPRHIKEAEETRRWQEEMKMLQQQNQPGFEIHFGSEEEMHFPEDHEFTRPNFYADTLQNSPIPHPRFRAPSPVSEHRLQGYPEFDENMMPPRVKIEKEEEEGKNWINIDSLIQQLSGPNDKPLNKEELGIKHEPDFTSDIKFDETTQFSEMGMPMNLPHPMPPYNTSTADDEEDNEEFDDGDDDDDENSSSDQASNQDSPNRDASEEGGPSKPLPPPIVIPNHLPRKQRELFLRIQQHQRRNITTLNASGSPSSDDKSEAQDVVNDEEEMDKSEEKKQSKWYSSEEDDDDDTDRPLANVLKKLREEPPKQVSPVTPSMNLIQMLSNISHNDNSKPLMDAQHSQQGAFWESILTGAVPPSMGLAPPVPIASNPIAHRRTLLPDPQMLPPPSIVEKKEVVLPKDPRLKRRDPRTRAATTLPNVPVVPTVTIPGIAPDMTVPPPLLPPIALTPQQQQPKVNELTKLFPKPVETAKESIPYKLHGIFTKPPNYMPYIHASQSDPKLLNDPRLRRHILQVVPPPHHVKDSAADVIKVVPTKEAPPPIPPLLLQYGKPDSKLSIDIFEPNPTPKTPIPKPSEPKLLTAARRLSDPRIRTRDILLDQIGTYGSTTPPHLTIHEPLLTPPRLQEFKSPPAIFEDVSSELAKPELKWQPPILENWLPPVLEKNLPSLEVRDRTSPPPQLQRVLEATLPPSLIKESSPEGSTIEPVKKVVPKTASHLPRAIADPRMAKLHNPLDPRRRRVAADINAISGVQVKVAIESAEVKGTAESVEMKLETAELRIKEETVVKVNEYPGLKFIKDEPIDSESFATIKEEPIDIEPDVTIKEEPIDIELVVAIKEEPVCDEINEPRPDIRDTPGLINTEKSGTENEQEFELKIKDESVVKDEPIKDTEDEQINPNIENTPTVNEAPKSLSVEQVEVNPIKKKAGCIPKKKKAIEKNDEKKKTVHRNRKSSMDYASPLNSCDDNSTNTLGYNSYNHRLRQRTAKPSTSASLVPVDNRIDVAPMISEFLLSDGSNQECDSSDVNVKDMFKTIDPTASPFC